MMDAQLGEGDIIRKIKLWWKGLTCAVMPQLEDDGGLYVERVHIDRICYTINVGGVCTTKGRGPAGDCPQLNRK